MKTPLTVMLDENLHRHLEKFACMRHTTMSAVVREALKEYTDYGRTSVLIYASCREEADPYTLLETV